MNFRDIFSIAIKNVRYMKKRTTLTMLSVCVGIASVVLISSLGDSGAHIVEQEIKKMGVSGITLYSNSENISIKQSDIDFLTERVSSVKSAQPFIVELGSYQIKGSKGNCLLWGVDKNIENIINLELLHGRSLNSWDIAQKGKVAIVDSEFAVKKYKRENIIGKEIIINVSDSAQRFKIVGVISAQKDGINQMVGGIIPEFIYIPYTTLGDMRSNHSINQIAIKSFNEADNQEIGKACISALARIKRVNKGSFGFEDMSRHVNNINSITKFIAMLISAIAGISLIVAGLDIVNTTVSTTIERRREIGIMMATGARERDIALLFIVESCVLSSFGGLVGIAIGTILSFLISNILSIPFAFDALKLIFLELIAIFCGAVFSFLPSLFASRKPPIETLRE